MATEPSLIEVGIITAHGLRTVLPCINWRGAAVAGLWVTLAFEPPHAVRTATTATGVPVAMSRSGDGRLVFVFDLEPVADAIILRP